MPDYNKGIEVIREEIASRLRLVRTTKPGFIVAVGKVYSQPPMERNNAMTKTWKEKFQVGDMVNCWWIWREGDAKDTEGERGTRKLREHEIHIQGFLGHLEDNLPLWDVLVDAIKKDLATGDRTLNLACLTHEIPQSIDSGLAMFMGVNCHSIILSMKVMEVYSNA